MKIRYRKSFLKAVNKCTDSRLKSKIEEVIFEVKEAVDIAQIRNIKKLRGYTAHYRIRIGSYRIGIEVIDNEVWFNVFADRKDIYKKFP